MSDTPQRIRVTFDEGDPIFDAWTYGYHWNGFATPIFNRENADRIAAMNAAILAENPDNQEIVDRITYEPEHDRYRTENPAWDLSEPEYVKGHYAPEAGENLYAIGTYGWTWEEVTEPGQERVCVRSMFR